MTSRVLAAALGAAVGLAITAPTASATDFFATTDNSRTTQDCLSEATACALGKALQTVPSGFSGGGNPSGKHSLTLLPGRYDDVDLDAGATFGNFNLTVKAGTQVGGKAGAERPVLAFGDPGGSDAMIEMVGGGALRDVAVECASFACVEVSGLSSAGSGVGVIAAVVERVRITSAPAAGGTEAYGLSLREFSRAANVDVAHSATQGAAVSVGYDQPEDTAPRLVAVTATSPGPALSVAGGRDGSPETLVFAVIGSVLRGTPDVQAQSDGFTSFPPPGFQANPLRVDFKNSAVRTAPASRLVTTTALSGPVSFVDVATVDTADLQLGADRVPAAGSPLVDKGTDDTDLGLLDALGKARTSGAAPDVGAYELGVTAPGGGGNPTPGGGTPPPAGSTPVPMPPAPAPTPDSTGPTPTLTTPKTVKRSKLTKGKGISFAVKLDEPVASAKLELLQITKKKGKTPKEKVLGSATLGAGGPALTFVLKSKTSKVGKKGKLKLTLRFTFVDVAGNKTVVEKPVTVR